MIRIDCIWLALGASDLRGGIDKLLAQVVHSFVSGAQAHHAYVFANRRADRLKVLVFDGVGMWLCTRRLQSGSFEWPRQDSGTVALTREQIKPPPSLSSGLDGAYVTGIATEAQGDQARMLILVDIERLMSSDDIGLLDAVSEAEPA